MFMYKNYVICAVCSNAKTPAIILSSQFWYYSSVPTPESDLQMGTDKCGPVQVVF